VGDGVPTGEEDVLAGISLLEFLGSLPSPRPDSDRMSRKAVERARSRPLMRARIEAA